MTNGQVPETIMKGGMADISSITEFGWYEWVMLRDNLPSFPDDKLTLGQYLSQFIDIGPDRQKFGNLVANLCVVQLSVD